VRTQTQLPLTGGAYDDWATLLEQDPRTVTRTTAYTATALDHTLRCDASGGAFTVTLPKAADNKGLVLVIKKVDSSINAVTIDGSGSETIDGAASVALATQYAARTVQSNGTGWDIIASV
jgi:hypothetical protein